MRRILALLLLFVLPGRALGLQPGVALRWDSCLGDGGTENRAFACDTNAGSETLVASFVPGRDFNGVTGYEPQVDFFASTGGVPAWWFMKNIGTCRTSSISTLFTPPVGAAACIDAAPGLFAGGIGAYAIGFDTPDRIRVRLACAVPPADTFSLFKGEHYFAFRILINHAKTIGAGSCAGCAVPMCIGFSGMRIASLDLDPELTPDCPYFLPVCGTRYMFGAADGAASDRVTWQGGVMPVFVTGPRYGFEMPNAFDIFQVACSAATPVRTSTWGAIKSLYR